jgi:hypothetical protein
VYAAGGFVREPSRHGYLLLSKLKTVVRDEMLRVEKMCDVFEIFNLRTLINFTLLLFEPTNGEKAKTFARPNSEHNTLPQSNII